jgi:hypothetical protein
MQKGMPQGIPFFLFRNCLAGAKDFSPLSPVMIARSAFGAGGHAKSAIFCEIEKENARGSDDCKKKKGGRSSCDSLSFKRPLTA